MKSVRSLLFFVACVTLLSASLSFAAPQFGVRASGGVATIGADEARFHLGVGGMVLLPLSSSIDFAPELSFMYRQPGFVAGTYSEATYTEFALELPLLFRFSLGSTFYLQIGPQGGLAFASELEMERTDDGQTIVLTEENDDRFPWELGIAAGFGFHIGANMSLDFRYFRGLTPFMIGTVWSGGTYISMESNLTELSLGFTYLF